MNSPFSVAVDNGGNIYIADTDNHRIRKVDGSTQNITSIAGNGGTVSSGDDGLATAAAVASPTAVSVDSSGNVYIAERDGKIRKIDKVRSI